MIDFKLSNLDDYELINDGKNSSIYLSKAKNGILLKLFKDTIPFNMIEKEFHHEYEIKILGISCPETYGMVSYENRYGILSQQLLNKVSICRKISANYKNNLNKYMKIFASECKKNS